MTSTIFWERLRATGLASPEVCRQWSKEIENSQGHESSTDPLKIASALIRSGRLTQFQLNCISETQPPVLVVGPYSLTETLSDRLGPNWFECINTSVQEKYWCFQLRPNQLSAPEIRNWPPSLELAKAHRALESPYLDRWESVIAGQGTVSSFCKPVAGRPLSEIHTDGPMPVKDSIRIVTQIAKALQTLHTNQLTHGCLGLNQCWDDGTACIIRRNILFVPRSPYADNSDVVFSGNEKSRWSVAAPEFILPDVKPTPQTDLYALGILWLQLLKGPAFWKRYESLDALGWKKIHTQETPEIPERLPESDKIAIRKLLAKNPTARYKSTTDLLHELSGVTSPLSIPSTVEPAPNAPITTPKEPGIPQLESKKVRSEIAPEIGKQTGEPKQVSKGSTAAMPPKKAPAGSRSQPATPAPATPATATPATATPATATPATATPAPATPAPATPAPATPAPATPAPATPAPATPAPATPAPATSKAQNRNVPGGAVQTKAAVKSKKESPKKSDLLPGKRRKKKPTWFLPVLAIGSMAFMGILVAILSSLGGGGGASDTTTDATTIKTGKPDYSNTSTNISSDTKKPVVDPMEEFFTVLPDDGKSLWAPPGVGPAYSVELLPPGLELFAVFSSDLWTGKKAGSVQKWLIESTSKWTPLVASYPKITEDQLKRVSLAVYPGAMPGTSELVLRYELQSPLAIKDFFGLNSGFKEQSIPGAEQDLYCWSNGTLAVVFDGFGKDIERKVTTITSGPLRVINSFSETGGGVSPLSRQLESLISVSNSDVDLFVLTTPSYLYGNGREMYSDLPRFRELFREAIDDTIQAISISATLRDSFYFEGRMIAGDVSKSGALLSKLRDSIDGLANKLETQFAANPVAPYWRLIASRYPQMIRSFARNTRMGLESGQLVANVYQPRESVENLAIGTWMSIQDNGSSAGAIASSPTAKPLAPKLSVEDILNRPMSLAFAQESLEMALAAIATEFNDTLPDGSAKVEMMINGGAFQKEGITQNQQIRDFTFDKTPLRDLLTSLVRRANPVTTVQSTKEKDQKVVWVVLDSPNSPGGKKIELTTRTWAETNGAQLPLEFLP